MVRPAFPKISLKEGVRCWRWLSGRASPWQQLFHCCSQFPSPPQPLISAQIFCSCDTQQEIPVVVSPSASTCGLLPGYIFVLFSFQHGLRLWGKQLQRGRKTKPNPNLSQTALARQLNFILTNPSCSEIISLKSQKKQARCSQTCSTEILP